MSHEILRRSAARRADRYVLIGALALLAVSCGGSAGIGERCEVSADCRSDLQCLAAVCTPRCETHVDCGDGYRCEDSGECAEVVSAVGDRCAREVDCGRAQSCTLDSVDSDGDGILAATCQPSQPGAVAGAACDQDVDCQSGICSLGRCSEVCVADTDCPSTELACVTVPRPLPGDAPVFSGCLQAGGTLEMSLPASALTHDEYRVPVPSHARSFAVIARIDDDEQFVGATRVTSPGDEDLYLTPNSPVEFYANKLRYAPARAISTIIVPNTPVIELETGVYELAIGSQRADGGNGTEIPEITVLYKLDDAATLDLNFYFLDLADHPCKSELDGGVLSASTAGDSPRFASYLATIGSIFDGAGIEIGEVTYHDVTTRPDLDGLDSGDLEELLALSDSPSGLNLFVVRSISPTGLQALVGGTPGPPSLSGTEASGIALALDTLCYRDWLTFARITSHAIGRHMGLFRNREPSGPVDPIPDSDTGTSNLMFFSELGGISLSEGQAHVLRLFPGLR